MNDEQVKVMVLEASSHLGAAISQSLPTDDQIIMDHVRSAHVILVMLWKTLSLEGRQ
jgi:hypothetical protein